MMFGVFAILFVLVATSSETQIVYFLSSSSTLSPSSFSAPPACPQSDPCSLSLTLLNISISTSRPPSSTEFELRLLPGDYVFPSNMTFLLGPVHSRNVSSGNFSLRLLGLPCLAQKGFPWVSPHSVRLIRDFLPEDKESSHHYYWLQISDCWGGWASFSLSFNGISFVNFTGRGKPGNGIVGFRQCASSSSLLDENSEPSRGVQVFISSENCEFEFSGMFFEDSLSVNRFEYLSSGNLIYGSGLVFVSPLSEVLVVMEFRRNQHIGVRNLEEMVGWSDGGGVRCDCPNSNSVSVRFVECELAMWGGENGGVVFVRSAAQNDGGEVEFVGVNATGNRALLQGGVARVHGVSSVSVEGGVFDGNSALDGGVFYLEKVGSVTFESSVFVNNSAVIQDQVLPFGRSSKTDGCGGAITSRRCSKVIIRHVEFQQNRAEASGKGGALFVHEKSCSFGSSDSDFRHNEAGYGGGLYVDCGPSGNLSLVMTVLTKNRAISAGGGLFTPLEAFSFPEVLTSAFNNTAPTCPNFGSGPRHLETSSLKNRCFMTEIPDIFNCSLDSVTFRDEYLQSLQTIPTPFPLDVVFPSFSKQLTLYATNVSRIRFYVGLALQYYSEEVEVIVSLPDWNSSVVVPFVLLGRPFPNTILWWPWLVAITAAIALVVVVGFFAFILCIVVRAVRNRGKKRIEYAQIDSEDGSSVNAYRSYLDYLNYS